MSHDVFKTMLNTIVKPDFKGNNRKCDFGMRAEICLQLRLLSSIEDRSRIDTRI
jgi:hypothetical protein